MLVPILRAAHCRSTHHFFAIDALERIAHPKGIQLRDNLLKHYREYLTGRKRLMILSRTFRTTSCTSPTTIGEVQLKLLSSGSRSPLRTCDPISGPRRLTPSEF